MPLNSARSATLFGAKPKASYVHGHQSSSVTAFVYPFDNGFGTVYAQPSVAPTGNIFSTNFNNSSDSIALNHNTSPTISVYEWSDAGFGTKYANPSTSTGVTSTNWTRWDRNNEFVGFTSSDAPRVHAYFWLPGFGSKLADPATTIPNVATRIEFSFDNNFVAVGHVGAPYVTVYNWSSSGFGTKIADPSTAISTTSNANPQWANGDNAIGMSVGAIAGAVLNAYAWTGTAFGTKFTNPVSPVGSGNNVDFSATNNFIAAAHSTAPGVSVWNWSVTGFGTKFLDPAGISASSSRNGFNDNDDVIVLGNNQSPFVHAFQWSNSGFGTKFADPATTPTTTFQASFNR